MLTTFSNYGRKPLRRFKKSGLNNDISTNFNGEPKAINVKKIIYDFDSSEIELYKSTISHINKYRGIGFISHQPENLYFHQAFLDENVDFEKFEIGTSVDYLIGTNDEGEKIARKVRITEELDTTTNIVHLADSAKNKADSIK